VDPVAAPPASTASLAPTADAGVTVVPAADAGVATPARFELAAAPTDTKAHVEILFPFAEQRIVMPKARAYKVRSKVEGWPLAAEGRGVVIALDDHRPRRVLDKAVIELGSLVDDDASPGSSQGRRELAAGPHWLAMAAIDESHAIVRGNGASRAPYAMVRFWVGDRDPERGPAPGVVLLSPDGTYNGERASSAISVDFLPITLGLEGGATVRVTGPGVQIEQRLSSWQPVVARDLPSGDFRVEVEVSHPSGPVRSSRTVTVNRELK
jgi:hypothetical protein